MNQPFKLPLRKRIFTHAWFQAFASFLIALGLRLIWLSFRKIWHAHPDAAPYVRGDRPAIFCFWHGRMIVFPCIQPKGRVMHVLISFHRDGELIARVIEQFGIKSIRGSSSKGAKEATRLLISKLHAGENVAITPDGPRGPAQQVAKGALTLARLSGIPIVPVSFSASFAKQLTSWDRFMIPLPFSRVVVEVGEPILIAESDDKSQIDLQRAMLAERLNHLTHEADRKVARAC